MSRAISPEYVRLIHISQPVTVLPPGVPYGRDGGVPWDDVGPNFYRTEELRSRL